MSQRPVAPSPRESSGRGRPPEHDSFEDLMLALLCEEARWEAAIVECARHARAAVPAVREHLAAVRAEIRRRAR